MDQLSQTLAKRQKRMGRDGAPAREAFLEAAETLLRREGYAALSARGVAEEAAQTKQLLYYYFENMDELIGEMFNRIVQGFNDSLAGIFADPDPVHALWRLHTDTDARLFTEYMALANRHAALRAEVLKSYERNTAIQVEGLSAVLRRRGIGPEIITAETLLFLLISAARNFVQERELGLLQEADAFALGLDGYFRRLALPATSPRNC